MSERLMQRVVEETIITYDEEGHVVQQTKTTSIYEPEKESMNG